MQAVLRVTQSRTAIAVHLYHPCSEPLKSVLAVSGNPLGVALGADDGQRDTSGAVGTLHTPGQRGPEDRCGGLSATCVRTEKLHSRTQAS